MRLKKSFFDNETLRVASSLIGKVLVKYTNYMGNFFKTSGIITETEAYGYTDDPASHAFKRLTLRNASMFGEVGRLYIYFIYGNHHCLNIVARNHEQLAGAVLIRSIEPIEGISLMKLFRKTENIYNLTTGPGKLTQAFKITIKHNNLDVTDQLINNHFYVEENVSISQIHQFKVAQTIRIGISTGIEKKWRFIMLRQDGNSLQYQPSKFLSRRS
ncbi:DNA-3-methyladenine glycosylase [Candidatus Nitrosocosmicus arcticus]|uniref:Putative 3-methyladenine DNA glycosylase n=1 Tax=Candidatus Nitrosocosmicus arcticus TaxID=2035267 RepID=A0A557SVJ4_9ARCH|nr:DNA-3-methyladenine glycosylase [Candidatus Nitrosocosmicus arcticus]TVP40616.1 putative 3-methyladenine DNA glycosylase [Candidatus Nitrosocosmicus arcticus]